MNGTTRDNGGDGPPPEPSFAFEDASLARGFTAAPNWIFDPSPLSTGSRLTYLALLHFAWQDSTCFPGLPALATAVGCNQNSITRYVQELVGARLISVKRRGLGRTNLYTFLYRERPLSPKPGDRIHEKRESGDTKSGSYVNTEYVDSEYKDAEGLDDDGRSARGEGSGDVGGVSLPVDGLVETVCRDLRCLEDSEAIKAVGLSLRKYRPLLGDDELRLQLSLWVADRGTKWATAGSRIKSWNEWLARAWRDAQRLGHEAKPPDRSSGRTGNGRGRSARPEQYIAEVDREVADIQAMMARRRREATGG